MQIIELSRFSQLSDAHLSRVVDTMTEYGIDMDSLVTEISNRVTALPEASAKEAAEWYVQANGFAQLLADTYSTSIEIAAGVISAVSPRMPWLRNKTVAEIIIRDINKYDGLSPIDAAKEIALGLNSNVAMAVQIARGEDIATVLSGTKRRSFYNNIVSPFGIDSVTVDTWMMMAFCNVVGVDKNTAESFLRANRTMLGGTGAGYFAISEAVRMVAHSFGMTANAVQGVYWVSVSGSFNGGREDIN